MIDAILVGFNDANFEEYVGMVRSMGTDSGAYRDLNLAFVNYRGRPYRAMDLFTELYNEGREGAPRQFSNADFLWPVTAYLGHYLHKRGFSFELVNLFQWEKDKLRDLLLHEEVSTVVVTTTVYVSPHPILEIISFIRQYNERVKIIVGGPYIATQTRVGDSDYIDRMFKYLGADFYVISSEGEAALVNLLQALNRGGSFDKIDNIAYRQGDSYVVTAASNESNSLEEDLIDYSIFQPSYINQFLSIRTAKSCPFTCSFCAFPERAGKYVYLPVESVERLLNHLSDLGTVNTLTFLDDTFNVPKPRFREIMQMMIRNRYGFRWNSFYRTDHGDARTIDLMVEAGCEGVFLGAESGSDIMLKRMNKTSRRHHYLDAIPRFTAAGVLAHTNYIIGFPGETAETVRETIDFLEEAKPSTFKAQLWYADPITPIWKQREEYGVTDSAFAWRHNSMDFHEASDWLDTMFLGIEGSTWLPQWGFEQWSMFYLQRLGMSLERVLEFMRGFNAAVRAKLLGREEIDPALVASLRACCQFDRPGQADPRPIELLDATRYRAAERFWHAAFQGASAGSLLELAEGRGEGSGWRTFRQPVDAAALGALEQATGEEGSLLVLAVLGALLARSLGREDATLLWSEGRDEDACCVPLRLTAPWDLPFTAYVERLRAGVSGAREHSRQALHILANRPRMTQEGCVPPLLEIGFAADAGSGQLEPGEARVRRAGLSCELSLTLATALGQERPELVWSYRAERLSRGAVEGLGQSLDRMLHAFAASPGVTIGEAGGEEPTALPHTGDLGDAAEAFNF